MISIFEAIQTAAERWAAKPALIFHAGQVSYRDFAHSVRRAARGFAQSVQPGDRVAIHAHKQPDAIFALFGAMAAGAIVVPVNPALKTRQVKHVLDNSGAKIFVTTPGLLARVRDAVDPASVQTPATSTASDAGEFHPHPVKPDQPAALIYTSGSTGLPKGVLISHANLVLGADAANTYLRHTSEDVILSLLPLSFDAGLNQLLTGIYAGAATILHDYLRPPEVFDLCAKYRPTSIMAVPPLWTQLTEAAPELYAIPSVRLFANTGGHMTGTLLAKLQRLFPQAEPFLMYGFTEAFRSTYLDPAQITIRPNSVGKAIPHATVAVLSESGAPCAPMEIGELVHFGPLVTLAYWNDPDATARKFRRDGETPAALSGDLVYADAEGFLYIVGRKDDMIKTSGYRVSPYEVEEFVLSTGLAKEVAVVGAPHDRVGQGIVSFIVPARGWDGGQTLLSRCRAELPSYMVPMKIVARPSLPRTPNGKVDRPQLTAGCKYVFRPNAVSGATPEARSGT